jgi:hypothetical protein
MSTSFTKHLLALSFLSSFFIIPFAVSAATANFTQGTATAQKFGTHEIVLTGNGSVTNPFDTDATVTFTPPSGAAQVKIVKAFYDGGNTWRARVYVSEAGSWQWTSSSAADAGLNGKSGSFTAASSSLRGMIKTHPANPKALVTDNGQWFPMIIEWGATLFNQSKSNWQQFVQDAATMGVNMIIADASGDVMGSDPTKSDPWLGVGSVDYTRYDLTQFQTVDSRAIWIFNNYPEMFLEWVLLSVSSFGGDGSGWMALPQSIRQNTMRYMIARWAAFPNLIWLNSLGDIDYAQPVSASYARDVGIFFAANDPWKHNFSVRGYRGMTFPFTSGSDLTWVGRVSLQEQFGNKAEVIHRYESIPLPIALADDWQEGYVPAPGFANPRYYYRWSFWSWMLSGGSAAHGSYYATDPPYSTSGYTGLDSVPHLWKYFKDRNIDLGLFQPDPGLMSDNRPGAAQANDAESMEVMRRGDSEFIVYHPNYSVGNQGGATLDPNVAAGMRIDLSSYPGTYQVEWYRPHDGLAQTAGTVSGAAVRDFTAPWVGYDAVMRLLRTGSDDTTPPPAPTNLTVSSISANSHHPLLDRIQRQCGRIKLFATSGSTRLRVPATRDRAVLLLREDIRQVGRLARPPWSPCTVPSRSRAVDRRRGTQTQRARVGLSPHTITSAATATTKTTAITMPARTLPSLLQKP